MEIINLINLIFKNEYTLLILIYARFSSVKMLLILTDWTMCQL